MGKVNTKDAVRILNNAMDIAYLSDVVDDTTEEAIDVASDLVDRGSTSRPLNNSLTRLRR